MDTTVDCRLLVLEKDDILYGNNAVYMFCPFHDDNTRPSMAVFRDGAKCFTCGKYLNHEEFIARYSAKEVLSAKVLAQTVEKRRPKTPKVDPVVAARSAHENLMSCAGSEQWDWLEARGINLRMVQTYQLGYNGVAYTLPVFDEEGNVITVRYRRDDAVAPHLFKFWGIKGLNQPLLYPFPASNDRDDEVVILTEGEMDALLLRRYGLPAYSFTDGNQSVPPPEELTRFFPNTKRIVLARDVDAPGKEGTAKLRKKLEEWNPAVELVTVEWPLDRGKDITEVWKAHNGTFADLKTQMQRYLEFTEVAA